MNAASKRNMMVVVAAILCVGVVVALGGVVAINHNAYAVAASDDGHKAISMGEVSDIAFEAPVSDASRGTTVEESAAEKADDASPELEAAEVAIGEPSAIDEAIETEVWQAEYVYDENALTNIGNGADSDRVNANVDGVWIAGSDFVYRGVHQDSSGYSYTYYSENVLPGGGLDIPGRHVNDEGYVVDGDGNICLASDNFPNGTVISIPFGDGTGVVYDCGSGYNNLDVYVSW